MVSNWGYEYNIRKFLYFKIEDKFIFEIYIAEFEF